MNIPTEQIAARAYQRFLARGGEHGHHDEDWLASEAELAEEMRAFEVVLLDRGDREIELVRMVRDLTGKGLREIKILIDELPAPIKRAGSRKEAEDLQRSLEKIGARVELRAAE